ncbi:MAG: RNA-binding cell elongation regulator Jag/EloR [Acidimicrobiia bacterium]
MEWVHTRGRSVQEAIDKALDQLGVLESETELEVLVEPKKGMFGKLGSADAEIRVRVKPLSREKPQTRRRSSGDKPARGGRPEGRRENSRDGNRESGRSRDERPQRSEQSSEESSAKTAERSRRKPEQQRDRSDRRESGDESMTMDAPKAPSTPIPEQAVIATEFVASVVAAFDVQAEVTNRIEDDTIYVDVKGDNLGLLVGPKGATLAALEDLVKVILQRRADGDGARVRVDVGGYQERRREALADFAKGIASKVLETGKASALAPMHPADRKLVHDVISDIEGVHTESQGMDPNRRIIVRASE